MLFRSPLLHVDPSIQRQQVERLNHIKSIRDGSAVAEALDRLEKAAQGNDELMPPILAAVRTYATLGEICGVLRKVFGEHRSGNVV